MNILQVQYLRKLQEAVLQFCTIEGCLNSWKISSRAERFEHLKCDFIIITNTDRCLYNSHNRKAFLTDCTVAHFI